jgi:hypothetical protein
VLGVYDVSFLGELAERRTRHQELGRDVERKP